jgi:hypothetical protein
MRKDKLLQESKNYLIAAHDNLRRVVVNASEIEHMYVITVLESIKKDVETLELLEQFRKEEKIKEKNKIETIEE